MGGGGVGGGGRRRSYTPLSYGWEEEVILVTAKVSKNLIRLCGTYNLDWDLILALNLLNQ